MIRSRSFRETAALLLGGAALLLPGCFRHHTIEPGTWRLMLEPRDAKSAAYSRNKPRDVEVTVEWGEGKKSEVVTVQYVAKSDAQERALRGTIATVSDRGQDRGSDRSEIDLRGQDPKWNLWLHGVVHNGRSMSGNAFALGRFDDKQSFDGTWTMTKAEVEAAAPGS